MQHLDAEICERARLSRDARFDGKFFIGVLTTGIYCRPVCPVRPPKARNVRFFPTAAAAGEKGFRPCLRCRPESSPGTPAWLGTSATVSRALRLIAEGALDDGNVEELATRLGIGPRHLNRLFHEHLGASPIAVAQTRRLHFAKKLIDETDLSMAEIAFSSGFGSVRRFNYMLRQTYDRTPSELRQARASSSSEARGDLRLRLSYRPPFDWDSMVEFLAPRATPGVESVGREGYRRSITMDGHGGVIAVAPCPDKNELELSIRFPEPRLLFKIVERVRRMFDLGADPKRISAHLEQDPRMAPLVQQFPGIRLPGSWDGFELAIRAILGQQVTVRGATTLAGRLVQTFGTPMNGASQPRSGDPALLFPKPETLAQADIKSIGLPTARAQAIRHLAAAVAQGEVSFDASVAVDDLVEGLVRLPGIGDWTAQYVAMRALGAPDAFPSSDLGLLRAITDGRPRGNEKTLSQRAETWRPWRAYAALYLWKSPASQGKPKPSKERAVKR